MEEVIKRHLHVPAHLFRPNTKYFITASTYKKKPWLKTDAAKLELRDLLFMEFSEAGWEIEDWVILDNHYHWMANAPENPQNLPNIMRNIHREIALWVKKNVPESKRFRKIMYNYWDKCITFDKSYFTRLNYIWYNPVKHGYVTSPEQWFWGSFYQRFKDDYEETIRIINTYPCDKVKEKDDFCVECPNANWGFHRR